jgi:hypothetical protein
MTASEEVVLDVDGLRMRYGTADVLRDVSFQAHQGEVLVLLGPNGAGKTTTIEILEGFRMRSAGHVQVLGTDPAHGDEQWRARVGLSWSPGRTTPSGGCVSCWPTWAPTTPATPPSRSTGRGMPTSWWRRSG